MKELNMQLPYDIGDEVWVKEHGKFVEAYDGHMDYIRVPMRCVVQDIVIYMRKGKELSCEYTVLGDNDRYHTLNEKKLYGNKEACRIGCDLYNNIFIDGPVNFDKNNKFIPEGR